MKHRLVREYILFDNDPWTDAGTTLVRAETDGAGTFIEVHQPGMEDFVAHKATIRVNLDEVGDLCDALLAIRLQWQTQESQ